MSVTLPVDLLAEPAFVNDAVTEQPLSDLANPFLPSNADFDPNMIMYCGADVPDYEERCGANYSPPICGLDEACVTDDGCKYNCIKKSQCNKNLYNSLMENGKRLCNCAEEPNNPYLWACEYNEKDENEYNRYPHGYAAVPWIKKEYDFDDRNITLLRADSIPKYKDILAADEDFVDFFDNDRNYDGSINYDAKSVIFDDLFSSFDFMACETVDGTKKYSNESTIYEVCSVVIGYDDLTVSIPGADNSPAVLKRGHSWMFTCNRTLYGNDTDIGVINDDTVDPLTDTVEIDTVFNLDIHCCDPDDNDCRDDCTKTPVFQIGPFANLTEQRFFVKMDYEYGNKGIRERGFLHVESCVFEEIGEDNTVISGPLELLHDGCPNKFEGMSFLENLRNRTVEYSYREKMEMKPFRIDSSALSFNLTCDMLNCPWDAVDNKLCKMKDQCFLEDRYKPFFNYSETLNPTVEARSLARSLRLSHVVQSETVTRALRHPCSEVARTGNPYCVGDEERDCWTTDLCEKRAQTAVTTVSSARIMTTISAFFIVLML